MVLQGGNGTVEREVRERENVEREAAEDLEMGEANIQKEAAVQTNPPNSFHMSRMQRLSATNPLRLVMDNATRVASPSPARPPPPHRPTPAQPPPPPQPRSASSTPPPMEPPQPRSTPTPQVINRSIPSNSTKISIPRIPICTRRHQWRR